ncbi:hypothetical protein MTP99_014381 [Tenebrio molitor]|nr:hypothetical protein MTP99_014381 [Tenebrio molitor]
MMLIGSPKAQSPRSLRAYETALNLLRLGFKFASYERSKSEAYWKIITCPGRESLYGVYQRNRLLPRSTMLDLSQMYQREGSIQGYVFVMYFLAIFGLSPCKGGLPGKLSPADFSD